MTRRKARRYRPRMTEIADVIHKWGATPSEAYHALGADLGVAFHMPRDWARRGRIPVQHVDAVVRAARARGLRGINHELIVRLVAEAV